MAEPAEAWAREVAVPGPLTWFGYVIPCGHHAGDEPCPPGEWTVRVEQRPWVDGRDAILICPDGHRSRHPLIYPEWALRLIADPGLAAVAGRDPAVDWVPHVLTSDDPPYLHSDYPSTVLCYTRWGPSDHPQAGSPAWWERFWPGLWATGPGPASSA